MDGSAKDEMMLETHDAVIWIRQRLEDGDKRMDKIEHTLYGNAKPGLVERVADLDRFAGARGKLVWLTVGAGLAAAFGVLARHW